MQFAYVIVIAAVIACLRFLRANRIRGLTIFEFQRGLKYRKGRFERVPGPGQYWTIQTSHGDHNSRHAGNVGCVGQEVLTRDGAPLKVTIAASCEVVDPVLTINQQANFTQSLYLVIQFAVREEISGSEIDALIENRAGFCEKLRKAAEASVSALGLKLISADY